MGSGGIASRILNLHEIEGERSASRLGLLPPSERSVLDAVEKRKKSLAYARKPD
jgi:hypothetical protein